MGKLHGSLRFVSGGKEKSMIALIDYDMGNLASVAKALEAVGAAVKLVTEPKEAEGAAGVVLPGVGNFGDGMRQLEERGWRGFLREWTASERPFLGICLGLQMLFDASEEAPGVAGLGIVPGEVRKFPARVGKIPHMGWNEVRVPERAARGLAAFAGRGEYFYFVHSFYVASADPSWCGGVTDYNGVEFTAAVARGNLVATQFHPEKSQNAGLLLLKNFVEMCREAR